MNGRNDGRCMSKVCITKRKCKYSSGVSEGVQGVT